MKKILSIFLVLTMLIGVFAACNKTPSDPSEEESSQTIDPSGFVVTIGETEFEVINHNCAANDGESVLFDRDYMVDDKISLTTGMKGEGYVAVTVKAQLDSGNIIYKVLDVQKNASSDKSSLQIPVNGFVLYVDSQTAGIDGIKVNQEVYTSDYQAPSFERMDVSSIIPDNKNNARRLNMINPQSTAVSDDKIYYITNDFEFTVPTGAVAVILSGRPTAIVSVKEQVAEGSVIKDSFALVFCGVYNTLYAKEYYTTGVKLYALGVEKLTDFTDETALGISGKIFGVSQINADTASTDVLIYNNQYKSPVTPQGDGYVDFVVINSEIVYVGELGGKTLIPSSNGYIIKAKLSADNAFENIALGTKIDEYLVDYSNNSDRYIKTANSNYIIEAIDATFETGAKTVLYTDAYGSSTNTANGTCEVAFKNGKIISVSDSGNTTIPQDGYVFSVDPNGSQRSYAVSLMKLKEGDNMTAVTGGNQYGYIEFEYTGINIARYTDYMVIYNSSFGKSTNTNVYGYEIIVDADGIIIGDNLSGNSTIPSGGFVISGHGKSFDLLKDKYIRGATASYGDNKVKILTTPELGYYTAAMLLDERLEQLEQAKSGFYSLDYDKIGDKIDYVTAKIATAKNYLDKGDINEALIIAEGIGPTLSELQYSMYESRAVENRAAWYRSGEKNDDEVRATLEKVRDCNINALYIETWYNGTTIGYSENPLIKHNTTHGDFDVLESFCRISKEYDIEIHIWVENFFIGGPDSWLTKQLKDYLCIDRYGSDRYPTPSYGDFVFLNPYDRYCRDLVLGVYREIVENYDIDGVHLDYIRFSEPQSDNHDADFGYNADIIAGFQEKYNTTVDPHTIFRGQTLWNEWCKFREDIINSFVKEVYDMLQETKPELWLSAATFPAFTEMPQSNFQNFRNWVDNGWMDEIFSMSYGNDISYPVGNATAYEKAIGTKSFYSAGLSAFESVAANILVAQIAGVRDAGADGANLFSWGSFVNHRLNYREVLKAGIFSRNAVQTYKLSQTVAAGLERIKEDLDGVFTMLLPEESEFFQTMKGLVDPILTKAVEFDLENATDAQKLDYCNNTITELKALKANTSSLDNANARNALNEKIDQLINCLTQSATRLK